MLVRDYIRIDAPFSEQLQRARLDSVNAVLACTGDRLAAWSRTSDTIWCNLPSAHSSVFVKRYHYPRWSHRLRGMFRGTFFKASRARSEFVALGLMRQLGIQAVRPIAFGERRIGHFVRSCFLVTEAVPDAMPLSSFIKTFGDRRDSAQAQRSRREILTALARQVRHMHEAGFVHRDLFWRNVLIRFLPDSRFEFYFLDASVGKRIRMQQRRQDSIVSDIAAMGALAPDFCSKADQMRFLLTYLDTPRLGPQDRQWLRRVQARSDLFHASEWQRLQRSDVFDPPMLASERSAG
jgi:tRNA A-37 threonylcarbamoyl transferase component Bud32